MNSAGLNTPSVEDSQDDMDRTLRDPRLGKLASVHGSTFYFALSKRGEK